MDPVDGMKNPVYSRVITKTGSSQFLEKNLKTLIKCKNEYYPYLGGECLCGTCICGQCKCVHFKYNQNSKTGGIPSDFKTIYQ